MEDQAKELVQFLSHTRVDVRRSAVDAILGMTGSDEARELLRGTPVVKKLAGLIGDIDVRPRAALRPQHTNTAPDAPIPPVSAQFVAKPAVSALINLCGSRAMLDDIVAAGIAGRVMENLVVRCFPARDGSRARRGADAGAGGRRRNAETSLPTCRSCCWPTSPWQRRVPSRCCS